MEPSIESIQAKHFFFKDDGRFANSILPVIFYKSALPISVLFPANDIIKLFARNNWTNAWKDGVYTYNHYHSNTHEALGFYKGSTTLQIGGEGGEKLVVEAGDVLIIPAGVAHQNLQHENAVSCVGAYPNGIVYDIKYGTAGERPQSDLNIARVDLPLCDPVFGQSGELHKLWRQRYI